MEGKAREGGLEEQRHAAGRPRVGVEGGGGVPSRCRRWRVEPQRRASLEAVAEGRLPDLGHEADARQVLRLEARLAPPRADGVDVEGALLCGCAGMMVR